MKRDTPKLGPLEMEVVGHLANKGPSTVHQVQGFLENQGRKLAYTTVMTIMSRLYEKTYLTRDKRGRQYVYSLAKRAHTVREGMLATIYRALFKNDRLRPIANFLSETDDLSSAELEELKKLVDDKLKEVKRKS